MLEPFMGREYHDGMHVPYEQEGRTRQKARTRQALAAATRRLMAEGVTPTVEQAAAAAGVSRTAAYRYFPNQTALVLGAHPETQQSSLLPPDAPRDPAQRLDLVMATHLRTLLEWEPQLRATLRLSLDAATDTDKLPLRQGRVITWLEDALAPLSQTHPQIDIHRLAVAIRSATGIESLVWLTDVARLSRRQAVGLLRENAHALLAAALTVPPTGSSHRRVRPSRRSTSDTRP
jgi:AcrR family transcriptional regulator